MRHPGLGDITAVTFDMDGTLYSQGRVIAAVIGAMWPHRRFFKVYSAVREGIRGEGLRGNLRGITVGRVAERLGMDPLEVDVLVEDLLYGAYVDGITPAALLPGVRAFLESLVRGGIRIGLISDYPVERKLQRLGLELLPWRTLVDSDRCGELKPSPVPFIMAAGELGVPPERVLHIGDREDCDVVGAHRAGMKAALTVHGIKRFLNGRTPTGADLVITDYARIKV
ncbi:MAG: HAD family hydrolase [Myxococcota bacterium]|jgi:FMN phosphatase YigB (HAD superfamily)